MELPTLKTHQAQRQFEHPTEALARECPECHEPSRTVRVRQGIEMCAECWDGLVADWLDSRR